MINFNKMPDFNFKTKDELVSLCETLWAKNEFNDSLRLSE